MEVVHERCAGFDVHKSTVVVCVRAGRRSETRTFGTMTDDLHQLLAWLREEKVTHAVMESTGIYWRPVFNVLEDHLQLLVVNARHVKAVPGRKTDVKDSEWLAELLRHGLVRASFVPPRWQRELRDLVRYRRTLIQELSRHTTRMQKVLEAANIKLSDVASNVLGASGRAMLQEIAAGRDDPERLAGLALSSLRKKTDQLKRSLRGSVSPSQRFTIASLLRVVEELEDELDTVDHEVEKRMRPYRAAVALLDGIPGIAQHSAEQILAETGVDMTRWPSAAHFASWAKVCPGNRQSGGKRHPASTGAGNEWLRSALVEAVLGAVRAHRRTPNFFASRYQRLAGRCGPKRAVMAVAHSMLVAIYYMLRDGVAYQDIGANHWDENHRDDVVRKTTRRLEQLGYSVTLAGAPAMS